MGKITVERAVRSQQYYVYTYSYPAPIVFGRGVVESSPNIRPGKFGRVFYVGKGYRHRIFYHENEASDGCDCRKCHVIREIWANGRTVELGVLMLTPDQDDAYIYERETIKKIGIHNLVNVHVGNTRWKSGDEKMAEFRAARAAEYIAQMSET